MNSTLRVTKISEIGKITPNVMKTRTQSLTISARIVKMLGGRLEDLGGHPEDRDVAHAELDDQLVDIRGPSRRS